MFGKELPPAEKQTKPKTTFSKAQRKEEDEERWAAAVFVEFIVSLVANIAVIRKISPEWLHIILHLKLFQHPRYRLSWLSLTSFQPTGRISVAVIEKNPDLSTGYLMAMDKWGRRWAFVNVNLKFDDIGKHFPSTKHQDQPRTGTGSILSPHWSISWY